MIAFSSVKQYLATYFIENPLVTHPKKFQTYNILVKWPTPLKKGLTCEIHYPHP